MLRKKQKKKQKKTKKETTTPANNWHANVHTFLLGAADCLRVI